MTDEKTTTETEKTTTVEPARPDTITVTPASPETTVETEKTTTTEEPA